MKCRYIRVSTNKQKIERQKNYHSKEEHQFIDVISGTVKFSEREAGIELIKLIKQKKVSSLTVVSIDRLGRDTIDILKTIEFFNLNNVELIIDNLGISSLINGKQNPVFKIIVSVMSNIAEMEREMILERQRKGIELAKLNGTYKGRLKGTVETESSFLDRYKNAQKDIKKGISLRKVAKLNDISLGTVQKVKKVMLNKSLL
ncbi:transposase [Tenacibaculum discolor]|uniref:Recombinase family protein n=1 Tax=Tenacibaculum discolor TaxID=361581 RepID=A0A2G1BTV5_9FLAO|nr:recombinase family protein [Tenacibaculum discolor]MDP2541540.1 recombinase family protein [Tenacibaculum discolor]PHN97446.1 transposase [Tenacibaculum discolor]PHN99357.1 transposase [Rhodobacteraceae bacterium 4F10]